MAYHEFNRSTFREKITLRAADTNAAIVKMADFFEL